MPWPAVWPMALCAPALPGSVEANEVFPVLPTHVINRLRAEGAVIREWPPAGLEGHTAPGADEALLRLVCSFATTEEEVERFLALAAG